MQSMNFESFSASIVTRRRLMLAATGGVELLGIAGPVMPTESPEQQNQSIRNLYLPRNGGAFSKLLLTPRISPNCNSSVPPCRRRNQRRRGRPATAVEIRRLIDGMAAANPLS